MLQLVNIGCNFSQRKILSVYVVFILLSQGITFSMSIEDLTITGIQEEIL